MSTDPIRKWLSALGTLCGGAPVDEATAEKRVNAFASLLARDYEPWAFTGASLSAVARQIKFWPSYGELCELLSGWCRNNRPASDAPRLSGPAPLSPDEYRAKQEAGDRAWWEDRVARLVDRPAWYRWKRAREMLAQVSQAESVPRPWLVPMLLAVIREAEADGADTSMPVAPPVAYWRRLPKAPRWGMPSTPQDGQRKPPEPVLGDFGAGIPDKPEKPPAPPPRPLSRRQLIAVYEAAAARGGDAAASAKTRLEMLRQEEAAERAAAEVEPVP